MKLRCIGLTAYAFFFQLKPRHHGLYPLTLDMAALNATFKTGQLMKLRTLTIRLHNLLKLRSTINAVFTSMPQRRKQRRRMKQRRKQRKNLCFPYDLTLYMTVGGENPGYAR